MLGATRHESRAPERSATMGAPPKTLESLNARLSACASTCMLADLMCSSRATSASRGTTMQNLYMDARVNVRGTHIGHMSAQHAIAAARTIYHQAGGMLNSRARADAHLRTTFSDKPMARTIA